LDPSSHEYADRDDFTSVLFRLDPSRAVLIRPIHAEKIFFTWDAIASGIWNGSAQASAPAVGAGLSVPRLVRSGEG
jgi:hypothetical protein